MDRQYLQGEDVMFTRSDMDVVLPSLENSTKKKFNSSFSAEQRRFENLEKQIRLEKDDMTQRLSLEKKYFLRSNLVLKERRELSSRHTARKKDREVKMSAEESMSPEETQEQHSAVVYEEKTPLERSPYYFPPLYKNVEKDLKELQTMQVQMEIAKKEPVDTETIRNCRYLRLSTAQKREIETEKSSFGSEFEYNSAADVSTPTSH